MFVSVMSILQERLPCASFYFRQHKQFKHNLQLENERASADDVMAIDQASAYNSQNGWNFDTTSRESFSTKISSRSKDVGGEVQQYITAIAQPRMIDAWSPVKKGSTRGGL